MKTLGKISLLLIFLLAFAGTCFARLDYDKRGLHISSIARILKLDEEEIDLATALLLSSREWDRDINHRKYVYRIDQMAEEIYKNANKKHGQPDNLTLIKQINDYLYINQGYKAISDANNPDDLFLHTVIDNRRGYCLSLSGLYLSIGERLDLPLYGVVVPGHFFVRYDDGVNKFNIETTSKGNIASDEHYIKKFKAPINGHDNLYMKNLTKKQTIGCFFNNLGNSYNSIGNTDKARKIFENAIELAPSLTEALLNLGNLHYSNQDYTKARIYFNRALKINPDEPKIHLQIGNIYLNTQQPSRAIISLKKAIQYDPQLYQGYLSLAMAYRQKELYNIALDTLRKAMEYNNGPDVLREFGLIYLDMGQYYNAEEYLLDALGQKDCWADVYFELAIVYEKQANKEKEISSYQSAIQCDPHMTRAMQNLASIYVKNEEDISRGIDLFVRAIEIDPSNPNLYFGAGLGYAQMEEYGLAIDYYKKATRLNDTNSAAYFNLAVCYYNTKKYQLALENARIAQELGYELPKGFLEDMENRI